MWKKVNKAPGLLLELFARVANIDMLDNLKKWEKLKLVEDLHLAGFAWQHQKKTIKVTPGRQLRSWEFRKGKETLFLERHPRLDESWALESSPPFEWQVLLEAHELCHPVIRDVLDGEAVSIALFNNFASASVQLDPLTHTLIPVFRGNDTGRELLVAFGQVLRQSPFPFRACPVCKVVFTPGKNQKFCAPACKVKNIDTARKDHRREYMRKYMAARRKPAKRKQAVK